MNSSKKSRKRQRHRIMQGWRERNKPGGKTVSSV